MNFKVCGNQIGFRSTVTCREGLTSHNTHSKTLTLCYLFKMLIIVALISRIDYYTRVWKRIFILGKYHAISKYFWIFDDIYLTSGSLRIPTAHYRRICIRRFQFKTFILTYYLKNVYFQTMCKWIDRKFLCWLIPLNCLEYFRMV